MTSQTVVDQVSFVIYENVLHINLQLAWENSISLV